ncbi:uncharacterized protein LOC110987300 [Acanthaster planci]|uniref:Uncharacterized protein LOC110987300 n=1 Tax=Acanthaster planci TaxID=133434 RepID=A0A8B7ZJ83_ACAPL|nr:uncharacterized protein LOC110987300 [Acanthaster planci]
MKFLRSKAKLFADFFQSNRQSTCTKFIVTGFPVGSSVQEETKAGGTVLLYEQGALTQEDFEPPSKPTKPQCTVVDHNTVNVSWSPPQHGGNCVQRYIVKFKRFREKNPDGIYDEVYTEQADTCVSIKDLEPNETLELWVAAICEVGVSPASDSSGKVTTLPASPPGKPEACSASASSITLEWKQPAQSGKQISIRSYTIAYGIVVKGAVNDWQSEIDTGSSETRFIVRKLDPNTSYMFQVVAIYDSGVTSLPSDTSDACSTDPVSQPGKPECSDVTASSVTMKWTDPSKIGKGVKLREYFIEYAEVDKQHGQSTGYNRENALTTGLHHTLADLMPNTTYSSHVTFVCESGHMAASEPSDLFTTLPAGPPTNVAVNQISATNIELTWSGPTLISQEKAIRYYQIGYQFCDPNGTVEREVNTKDPSCTFTINEAAPEMLFKIRVTAVCGEDETLGEHSSVVLFTTRKLLKHDIRVNAKVLQRGNPKNKKPCVLKFPLQKVCLKDHSHSFRFGEPPKLSGVQHKVIMLVGVTGSGKSTLINGMINYILDVERSDDFRFKIVDVDEARGSSQAHSQTQVLTSYTVYRNHFLSLPYTLTVIDTPGFGDTRGIERDKVILEQIREFFSDSESHGIDHIDAIGFVVQASQPRLTPTQKYVFDSILSVFGKDISENILLLVTFADSNPPPVLDAVEEAEIPFNGSIFKFNNSALFAGLSNNKSRKMKEGKKNSGIDDMFWIMGKESFEDFFSDIQGLEARSLVLTKAVLDERKRLEVAVQGLQPQMRMGFCKLEELRREHQLLEQHEADIEANKEFKMEVEVPKCKKIDITGNYITNCNKCHFTCHYPCYIADDAKKAECAAMDEGVCQACPGKCPWDVHFNQQYRFEYYTEKETRTYEEIEARYKDATGKKMTVEQVIQNHTDEFNAVRCRVFALIGESHKSVMRLEEIALKPNPLSAVEYVDILIESEKNSGKPGWQDRVSALQDLRKQADIISKVKHADYDPFERFTKDLNSISFKTSKHEKKTGWFSWFGKKP